MRPVAADEVSLALSMILGSRGVPADTSAVGDFLKYANDRAMNLSLLHVAVKKDILGWAGLPMPSPGRTLMMLAADASMIADRTAVAAGVEAVCRKFTGMGIQLAQVLVDPSEPATVDLYAGCGFQPMAELLYMHRSIRRTAMPPLPAGGLRLLNYSPANHALFAAGILATYEQSLDCPLLNGVRDIQDVIAGHKSAGVFDPGDWFVLTDAAGDPIAVLLMTRVNNMDGMEIVYVGTKPAARGRGLGDYLIRLASGHATLRKCRHIALAVDAQNRPAIGLYHRHGFERSTSRVALMRVLNPGT